jgi:hypothetical protein
MRIRIIPLYAITLKSIFHVLTKCPKFALESDKMHRKSVILTLITPFMLSFHDGDKTVIKYGVRSRMQNHLFRDGILGHQFNKRLESLLQVIHSPFYWRILQKNILFSGLKKSLHKIRETRKLESIHEKHFVERKIEGIKPDKNSCLRRLEFMPRFLD